ncbi:hypothetical protein B0H14DRAFT_1167036 [Mycena olivaceomarginata]|nr:hypothetical protein B0H14DRAFT_1167036 [Mycena olivaceomarginata]
MPASLERSIRRVPRPAAPLAARGAICSTTTARAIRYRRALPFLPPPLARHHAGANTSPNRTTSRTRSTRRRRASPPTTPRRLPAHRDSSAVYCPHQPTPAPAVLPSTTSIASRVRCACDGRSPSPAPLLSPPRASSASPASTTLPDPHARRALACTTPRVRSTCGSRSPSPAARRRTSSPAATVSSASLSSTLSQLLSGTGSTTRSIAGVRSKCNEHSPSPTPPSSPPQAPRLSSAPTPASAPNLSLPRIANRTGTIPCPAHAAAVPLSPHTLPASHVHPQPYTAPLVDDSARRLPITSAGCVCRDDSAAGWRGADHMEAMRTPCFHRYPPSSSALGSSDKRGRAPRQFSVQRTWAETAEPALPRHFRSHRRLCSSNLRRAL